MEKMIERFKKYIAIDTKSDENSKTCPSSPGQLELGDLVAKDLKAIGLEDVKQDENGYVYATLKSNLDRKVQSW